MDLLMDKLDEKTQFIFVSHSIGSHFAQRMCILRPDVLRRTRLFLDLMPFVRMDATPKYMQSWLNTCARTPDATISIFNALIGRPVRSIPLGLLDKLMSHAMNDDHSRGVAAKLLRMPSFARNFGSLGLEEVRDVPERFDVRRSTILFGDFCLMFSMFCKDAQLTLLPLFELGLGYAHHWSTFQCTNVTLVCW